MEFYQRVRHIREDSDLTQTEMARRLGIKQQQYSMYETGQTEMPIRYLKRFCEETGVSADWLLGLPVGAYPK